MTNTFPRWSSPPPNTLRIPYAVFGGLLPTLPHSWVTDQAAVLLLQGPQQHRVMSKSLLQPLNTDQTSSLHTADLQRDKTLGFPKHDKNLLPKPTPTCRLSTVLSPPRPPKKDGQIGGVQDEHQRSLRRRS